MIELLNVDLSLKSLVKLLIQKWDNSQDMLSIQFSNVECKAKRKILLYISLMSKLELNLNPRIKSLA